MATEVILGFLSMTGILSILMSYLFNKLNKRMDEREQLRYERDIAIIDCCDASCTLGITIQEEFSKDGVINGRSEKASNYAREKKHRLNDVCTKGAAQAWK